MGRIQSCVLNPSDRYRVLKKGNHIARAFPIEKLISTEAQESPSEIRIVQDTNQPSGRIPDHLSDRIPVQESHRISDQRSDRIPVQDSVRILNQEPARIPVQKSDQILDQDPARISVHKSDRTPDREKDQYLPEHLRQMYEESKEHLSGEQQLQLIRLLNEFQDVFAKSEFDLGHFTHIHNSIDTGDAKPVKQRMRRTQLALLGRRRHI